MKLTLNQNRYLPHIASLAAAGVLALVAVDSVSSIKKFEASNQLADSVPAISTKSSPPPSKRQMIDPAKLAKLHVFGKAAVKTAVAKETKQQAATPESLPKSTIKLDIKGLFSNNDAKKGLAVITNNGQDQSFRVGDEIGTNIKLHAVYKGYVVIANNDKLERLDLPEFRAANGNQQNLRNLALQKRVAMSQREQDELEEALQ